MFWHDSAIWGGSLWGMTFPAATWLLAIHFGRRPVHQEVDR